MTIQQAYSQLVIQLFEFYDEREAAAIANLVIENITGFKRIDRIINKQFPITDLHQTKLEDYTTQLLQQKPVQYVLNEAWFAEMKLYVDENVLIPRPETEELVEWVVAQFKNNVTDNTKGDLYTLLDIGTGSGCIAIALKKKLPAVKIHAADISGAAIDIAKKNATVQQTDITFYLLNILDTAAWQQLPVFDIIVCNPPYIKQTEATGMHTNVLHYEPHVALFVPDHDPLVFYKTIAVFGLAHLTVKGKLYFEINEAHGTEVCDMLETYGYHHIELKKDLQGKDRMVFAEKPSG